LEHFVTLFDSLFLPQGLALHASMQRHLKQFTLWILCVDDETHCVLQALQLANVRLLQLSHLETSDLLKVKTQRTKGEYCWTLTPFAPRFVFETDLAVSRVTYIDADLWFRKDPLKIFQEFEASGKQVLITDHGYAANYDETALSGQFCVQFIIFERHGGELVRRWWEARCIEWCHARVEDGKFGDQKYLDVWPDLFKDKVHVLENKEWTLAPWNAVRFPYGNSVIYHFHGLRIISENKVTFGQYEIPRQVAHNIYEPYLVDLRAAREALITVGHKVKLQAKSEYFLFPMLRRLKEFLRQLVSFNTAHW
jgi:hypothetical protein